MTDETKPADGEIERRGRKRRQQARERRRWGRKRRQRARDRRRRGPIRSVPEQRSAVAGRLRLGFVRTGPALATLAIVLTLWQATVVVYGIPSVLLPSPVEVGGALVDGYATYLADAAVTAATAALGLLGGGFVGFWLAFAMTYSRPAAKTLLPYVIALRIAPLIAIAPLLFLWFGRDVPARALLVTTLTVFPVTIATLDGLRSTPAQYLDLAQSVDASRLETFVRIRIPAAAPSVLAGFEVAATLAVIGAVVAEFVTLRAGIGYRVFYTSTRLDTAESYAALVVLSLLGIAFYLLPTAVERFLWS